MPQQNDEHEGFETDAAFIADWTAWAVEQDHPTIYVDPTMFPGSYKNYGDEVKSLWYGSTIIIDTHSIAGISAYNAPMKYLAKGTLNGASVNLVKIGDGQWTPYSGYNPLGNGDPLS